MKRSKICGLLLALSTIFGLSFVVSSDTSALKYNVQSLPVLSPRLGGSNLMDNFGFWFNGDYYEEFYENRSIPENWFFTSNLNSADSSKCSYGHSYSNASDYVVGVSSSTFVGIRSVGYWLPYDTTAEQAYSPYFECQQLDAFEPSYPYPFLWGTLPFTGIAGAPLADNEPYWYGTSGYYVFDHNKNEQGLFIDTKLDFKDIFGVIPNKFKSVVVPIGFSKDTVGDLPVGREIGYSVNFYFDSDNPSNEVLEFAQDSIPYASFTIRGGGSSDDYIVHTQSISCSDISISRNNNELEYPYILSISCSGLSEYDFENGYYAFTFEFGTSTGDYLWDYPAIMMLMESSYVVSDGDYTDSGISFGDSVHTAHPERVPGSASYQYPEYIDNGVNWNRSLAHMFNFNFINPFAGIFGLFTDNNQCVDIPILASMLHSESSTYCPWFNSATRNILTPVLGIASVMLIFGFVVRWLGSSSGNFFEDSKNEEVSNQGGRWGHFKRGGF